MFIEVRDVAISQKDDYLSQVPVLNASRGAGTPARPPVETPTAPSRPTRTERRRFFASYPRSTPIRTSHVHPRLTRNPLTWDHPPRTAGVAPWGSPHPCDHGQAVGSVDNPSAAPESRGTRLGGATGEEEVGGAGFRGHAPVFGRRLGGARGVHRGMQGGRSPRPSTSVGSAIALSISLLEPFRRPRKGCKVCMVHPAKAVGVPGPSDHIIGCDHCTV